MIRTIIEGIPVYSTIKEALAWSKRNFDGEEIAHVHKLTSGFGYMGGTIDMGETIEPSEPPLEPPLEPPVPVPIVSQVAAAPQVAITPLVPLTTTTGDSGGY